MFGFNSLTPYNRDRKQNFLDSFFNEPFFPMVFGNELKTDIRENESGYSVSVEIPGVDKKDIAINYDENSVLSIAVNRSEEKEEEKDGYLRRERYEGSNRREFYLPGIDAAGIRAKVENGVLNIGLPKNKNKPSDQSINIE